jgi:PPOX class probable F420-dependent enzyme
VANVRDLIKMTPKEVDAFLHEPGQTMSVATIGPDGRPHVVAMWYGFLDGKPAFETYRKSQKVKNLERDPRMTCLVEDGERYDVLRGVELIARGTIVDDKDALRTIARSLFERYETGFGADQGEEYINFMVAKRVAVQVDIEDAVSWDHRKIVG